MSGDPRELDGKVALVVGGSRGIGAAAGRALATAGASVVLAARDEAALAERVSEIEADGGTASAIPVDVTDPAAVQRLVDRTVQAYGRLDIAFNNATQNLRPAPLAELDPDGFDRAIRSNVYGTFYGMRHQIPAMLASGGGSIINMASTAGLSAVAGLAGYVAGKAGIIGLTKVAALDYADQDIRVNVLAPGPILTHHLEAAGEQAQQLTARAVPMGRLGAAAEVADAVLWLASDRSSFVTGTVLSIDGGRMAGTKPPADRS